MTSVRDVVFCRYVKYKDQHFYQFCKVLTFPISLLNTPLSVVENFTWTWSSKGVAVSCKEQNAEPKLSPNEEKKRRDALMYGSHNKFCDLLKNIIFSINRSEVFEI